MRRGRGVHLGALRALRRFLLALRPAAFSASPAMSSASTACLFVPHLGAPAARTCLRKGGSALLPASAPPSSALTRRCAVQSIARVGHFAGAQKGLVDVRNLQDDSPPATSRSHLLRLSDSWITVSGHVSQCMAMSQAPFKKSPTAPLVNPCILQNQVAHRLVGYSSYVPSFMFPEFPLQLVARPLPEPAAQVLQFTCMWHALCRDYLRCLGSCSPGSPISPRPSHSDVACARMQCGPQLAATR